jgi:epoxyqueuosine reductase
VTPAERSRLVKDRARDLGFEAAGIATLEPLPHAAAFGRWLDAGYAGTMRYMHRQAGLRSEPAGILPGATRAVVVTRNYFLPDTSVPAEHGHVAKYARGEDYHRALREPLEALAVYLRSLGGEDTHARAYVDAGPVPERELAQRAGLGWIGKNTMLLSPQHGSYCFLASVLTDLDLEPDHPFEADRCGTCRRCLEACPTEAFVEPRVLDSRRCISYLTIEFRGEVPSSLAASMGNWVFGCDVCQSVCPWNVRFAQPHDDAQLRRQAALEWLDLAWLTGIGADEFERELGMTAMERPGVRGMRRNAAIAAANVQEGGRRAEAR